MNKQETDFSRLKYHTGLSSFALLMAVFYLDASYVTHTHRSPLSKFQQVMVVLTRLPLNLSEQIIANRFGDSLSTISGTFRTTLNILHACLKHLIIWPERDERFKKTMQM